MSASAETSSSSSSSSSSSASSDDDEIETLTFLTPKLVRALARKYKTPVYVYDALKILNNAKVRTRRHRRQQEPGSMANMQPPFFTYKSHTYALTSDFMQI